MRPIFVSLLLALLTACELFEEPTAPRMRQASPDPARTVVITGRVVSSATSTGIAFANVRVLEAGASVGTDETGSYRIVLPARFRGRAVPVQVRAIGFKAQSQTVALASDTVTVTLAIEIETLVLTCNLAVSVGAGREP